MIREITSSTGDSRIIKRTDSATSPIRFAIKPAFFPAQPVIIRPYGGRAHFLRKAIPLFQQHNNKSFTTDSAGFTSPIILDTRLTFNPRIPQKKLGHFFRFSFTIYTG